MLKRIFLFGVLAGTALLGGCHGCSPRNPASVKKDSNYRPDYSGITLDKTVSFELKAGQGAVAQMGSTVLIKYEGWVYDPAKIANRGPQFGLSQDGTFKVKIGAGDVVKGWEQGMIGMKEGGGRRLIIPNGEGYGTKGADNLPDNANLMVEVELVKVLE